MTTPDPFSSAGVPNPDEAALNQPLPEQSAPTDPSAYQAPPAPNHSGYASPPPPSQMDYSNPQQPAYGAPQYAQPQYGQQGYPQQQYAAVLPGAPATTDGVSIAALVVALLGGGPVAIVLGIMGLRRTKNGIRGGRVMAGVGLALGVLGTLAWVALVAIVLWVGTSVESTSTGATYGDDPYLDTLWDACEGGDMGACDDLYLESPFGSEYEKFGDDCGPAGRGPFQMFCDD